jgi:hypothetical protein
MQALQPPTPEQQQLAYRQLWQFGWPDTLDAALAKPAYALAINAVARRLGRAPVPARPAVAHVGLPPTPASPPARNGNQARAHAPLWPRLPAGWFDAGKAAANDRNDD